ncbi:MAG: bacterial Ig-like domain-containing protein [Acutalibacteraceae bacterium]
MTRTPRSTTRRPRCRQPEVDYTVKQVYNSPAAAGCVADFDFTGYSDSDYYYISGTRTPELSISGGAMPQQPADTPKEPARDPEPDKPAGKATLSITSRPNKTSYYIGDKLNTAGLTARYTDASGKAQTICYGFTTSADLNSTSIRSRSPSPIRTPARPSASRSRAERHRHAGGAERGLRLYAPRPIPPVRT